MKLLCCALLSFMSIISNADTLIVLNKFDSTASMINLDSLKVVATLKTGLGPHEVAVSQDGKTAVVTNYGSSTPGSSLTVIDIPTAKISSTVSLGKYTHPHGIAFINNSEVLVTAEDQKAVLRVDIKTATIKNISTDQEVSHMVAIDSKSAKAFVANINSNSISVVDLNTNLNTKDIPTGKGAEGIDFNPKTNEVWVTNRGENTISIIDAASLTAKTKIDSASFPIRVKFASGDNLALVTNAKSGQLNIFNAETKKLEAKIDFPKGAKDTAGRMFGAKFKDSSVPIGIVVDPKGNRAFVAHANLDQISVIDLKLSKLSGTITAGKEPDGMAYSTATLP
jgi:YVTN family beta-propeller protein